MNDPWGNTYYSIQVTPAQGRAMRDLIYFLMKLGLNKRGRTYTGMSMHKTASCEPGKYKVAFKVNG